MGPFLTAHRQKRKSCDSTFSTNIVEAAIRVFKKPVRKKQPISTEVIVKVCKRFASQPFTVIDLRTSLMFSLGFAGLFRANELLALRASDIKIEKDHLEVLVRKSKTDRYHQGNTVYSYSIHSIHSIQSALAFLFSCRYRATNRNVHIPANLVSENQRREDEKQSTYRILQLSRNYQKSTGRGWRNPRDVWHAQSQIRWSDGHC